jgi:ABC-2 type transport system permease protein
VDLRRLVYDATLVGLPLYVTVRVVDSWRWG